MTGRKKEQQAQKGKRRVAAQQVDQHQQSRQQQRQQDHPSITSTASSQSTQSGQSTQSQAPVPAQPDDSIASNAPPTHRIAKEAQLVAKKIIKAEIDESRTLKHVFKSNPDSQMKDFIKKAAKPNAQPIKQVPKTPADAHPPAVAQELLETDDDVADNLGKLFKASKSYKNL